MGADETPVEYALSNSSVLQNAANQLSAELASRMPKYSFDPVLIISIVGIIINIIVHCREDKDDEEIYKTIKNIEQIPPRKLMRLRRRLNQLWRKHHPAAPKLIRLDNPYILSVYQVAKQLPKRTYAQLLKVADEEARRGKKKKRQ